MFDSPRLSISSVPALGYGLKIATGETVIIDEEDLELVRPYPWRYVRTSRPKGKPIRYVLARVNGRMIYLHRLVTDAPGNVLVDHHDGDTLHCRKENLRFTDYTGNNRNRSSNATWHGRPATSRFKGVSWDKRAKRWGANIYAKGVQYRLGWFDTQEEAARAYDDGSFILHGIHGRRNFPDRAPEHIDIKAPEKREEGHGWRAAILRGEEL